MSLVSPELAAVVTAAEKLRAGDPLVVDGEALVSEVEALLAIRDAVDCVLVRRVQELQAADEVPALAGRSVRNWLTEDERLRKAQAARLVRLADRLPVHPVTLAAFDAGEIRAEHADAIVAALQTLPVYLRADVEPHLVERARHFPPEEISGFVDELLERLGIDKAGDIRRERRNAERGVDLAKTLHGSRSLSGTLTPDAGARLEQALALASRKTGPDDERSPRQRRHDALVALADSYLEAQGAPPSFTGAPRTVVVTIPLDVLEGRLRDALITLPGGTISAETARRLACDAELIPAVLGGKGEVLDIGQADHEFTTPIRRAAWLRDRGRCAFPDCTNRVAELHHLHFRRHDGPTSLHNAAWLCNFHHWLAHEGRWKVTRAPDGNYHWRGPRGQERIRRLDAEPPPATPPPD